ncbi:MAG: cryptochrome/photolyase family protein [Verrucomicrobiales bacterium]
MLVSGSPILHWFRRDLRILDNPALLAADSIGEGVLCVYVISDWSKKHAWTGSKRQAFLCESLNSLAANLNELGGRLLLRTGDPIPALIKLATQSGASAIFFNQDPDPHGRATERRLVAACEKANLDCKGFHDHTLHTPSEVLTQANEPYRVFTPYSRNWLGLEKPSPQGKPKNLLPARDLPSDALPSLDHWSLTPPDADLVRGGERAAHQRLKAAIPDRIPNYEDHRDIPAIEGTSRLSQDLRFGLLSIRTVYLRVKEAQNAAHSLRAKRGFESFIKELSWREFYFAILHHFPNVLEEEFSESWRGLPWDEPGEYFEAWKEGLTGFPIVDAGIRQLKATGFMHNRLRMITAMFFTKDLHYDWRLGESFFMQHLVDGEIASNNGGWQWSAGTGADAAPYFRIQNPWSQSKRHDPDARYIKRWVPELTSVPAKYIHRPPEAGTSLTTGYPPPCVDHAKERARTLSIFKKHRQQTS